MTAAKMVPLGEIVDFQAGIGFPPDLQGRTSGDYPLAKVGDISRGGRSGSAVLNSADHYVDEKDLKRLRARPIPPGSVLFAKIGEAIRQNHRVIAGCSILIDNNAMAAIPGPKIESRYLFHYLRTVDFYRLASATTVPALRKSELEKVRIPLPPLAEQKRIAAILDAAEALRDKRRQAIAKLEMLRAASFTQLFGDVINRRRYETRRLGDLVDQSRGISYGVVQRGEHVSDGIPLLRIGDILSESIDVRSLKRTDPQISAKYRRTVLSGGEIVISIRGTVGRCAVVPLELRGGNVTRELALIPLKDPSLSGFMLYLLQSESVQRFLFRDVKGVAQRGINLEDLRELPIIQPARAEIDNFHRHLAAIEAALGRYRRSVIAMDTLVIACKTAAFAGVL
jgi:type I restriction enzyme, S subunit